MNISLEGCNSRFEQKKIISDPEEESIQIIQPEKQKEKRMKKM